LVVSPAIARQRLLALVKGAKNELLIYDLDLADKEIMRVLEDRCQAGVDVRIIGHVSRSKHLAARGLRRMRLHTRVVIRDRKQAFLGSQSLRKVELDARREIGIIVDNAKVVSSLATIFEDDWKASADQSEEKKHVGARAERVSKRLTKAVGKNLVPAPVVQRVLKVIQSEARVEVDRAQAAQVMQGALKKAVRKAAAQIVEESIAR
jgi:cardiolipin synthase